MGCIGLPRGVKWCKSSGVICLLPPRSYTILPPLEAQCSPKRCKNFELQFPKKSSHCSPNLTSFYPPPPLAAQLLQHFTPLAAQLLSHFTPSILHWCSPHTWRLPVLNPQPLYPQLRRLILETIKACPTLDGLYIWIILVRIAPISTNYPLTLTSFYPPWNPNSYIILPPLNKLTPHSYTNLSPLAAPL